MSRKKGIVYTAIFDNHDILLDPWVSSDQLEYICFTDNNNLESEVWNIHITTEENLSPRLKNRKMKILPHSLFEKFEWSVYVDGNIHITGDLGRLAKKYLSDHKMVALRHPSRNGVYEEASKCIKLGKGDEKTIRKQMKRYKSEGFPDDRDLSANYVLFRKHNDCEVVKTMKDWWNELKKGSIRDQLSLNYVAWRNDFEIKLLNHKLAKDSTYFRIYPHKPKHVPRRLWRWWIEAKHYKSNLF